jgi:hypothetical protein
MKKYVNIVLALSVCLTVIACKSTSMAFDSYRKITKMSDEEIKESGIKITKRIIYTEDTIPVAKITSFEHECYKGNCIVELSITMNRKYNSASTEIMRYVYTKHPHAKIELNYDEDF